MAYSANQSKLYFSRNENDFVELEHLMEIPELGGTPEKIDVTTLADQVKKSIPGIKELGDLVFKFLYDNSDVNANYRVLKGMEESGEAVTFRVTYPDGTSHKFDAIPAVKIDAGTVNGALTFSATMMTQSDIEVVDPA